MNQGESFPPPQVVEDLSTEIYWPNRVLGIHDLVSGAAAPVTVLL